MHDRKMRILIIADEVWNDNVHANNVLTNWFAGFSAEFAEIYCSPGQPLNKCCKQYFQLTDMMMLKSIILRQKAGKEIILNDYPSDSAANIKAEPEHKKLYSLLKSITTESIREIRELFWLLGQYDEDKLRQFICKFDPDIIFCPRMATSKILRLERTVAKISSKPMVAFTGDDEYFLQQLRLSPIYWLRRFRLRSNLRKNVKYYSQYYTLSSEQGRRYKEIFGITTKTLRKCAEVPTVKYEIHNFPIKMVYAGKLYCNRWMTLAQIAKTLKRINNNEIKMVLEIYTGDRLSWIQKRLLHDGRNSFVKGSVSPSKLTQIYESADIALHVESFDLKNKWLTKYSFSTKIIDCLSSTCAVMAVCWSEHAGYTYLEEEDAAFCIDSYEKLGIILERISDNPNLINENRKKASECVMRNHRRRLVQQNIYNDFTEIIAAKND